MKKLSFTAGVATIALVAASILPVAGAFANQVASADFTNNPLTLSRTVSGVSNNVTNTFGYTITQGTIPSGATVSGAPATASIVFNNTAPTSGDATATTTVDFSSANFSKVGDYTYTIRESSSTDAVNYPIDTASNDYTALVQVRYYVDPNTNVPDNSRFVATTYLTNASDNKVSNNTATWGSSAARTYIEAKATTTGNMAETTDCFAYTINIPAGNGVVAGDTFTVSTASTCSGNPSSVTAGTATTIYLRHNDTVTVGQNGLVNQLPVGASYTWTKASDSNTGYTNKIDGTQQSSVTKTTVAVTNVDCDDDSDGAGCFDDNNHTDFENNKELDPLTGIVTNFWFYIMLLVAGLVGFFIISRRKQNDEE
ncbi:hypothetical protein J6X15_00650 [Candidatus Saccharibacteria bacterium]|nr:hypothetical protein [Candidatus Saccharibacteria bacterium]